MRIAIGSDHAGFELKESLRGVLSELHHDTLDLGTHSKDPVDYPDYAQAVGLAVQPGTSRMRGRPLTIRTTCLAPVARRTT